MTRKLPSAVAAPKTCPFLAASEPSRYAAQGTSAFVAEMTGMDSRWQIEVAQPRGLTDFWRDHERDFLSELWAFRVVWHEQSHELVARDADGAPIGGLRMRIAASLATIEALYVLPALRKQGIGRALVARCEALANYYNCHKVVAGVFADRAAERFLRACGYHVEAVLPQHTFKLDVALVRKFLL